MDDPSQPFPHPHGFAAHWDKNTNFAHHFDVWFLNLFPRSKPFAYNGGGYLTLSFIPSLATMIFGLLAGGLLKREDILPSRKVGILLLASVIGLHRALVDLHAGWLVAVPGSTPRTLVISLRRCTDATQ